jgi:hypothetical protein
MDRVRSRALFALVIIIGLAMPVAATTTPKFVVDPANEPSGIIVSRVTLFQTMGGGGYTECVFFTNTSPRPATRIFFNFEMSDYKGAIYQTDVFDRRGKFAPNLANDGFENLHQIFSKSRASNCHDTFLKRDPDGVRVRVMSVEYDDKTTWQMPGTASSASPAVASPSP